MDNKREFIEVGKMYLVKDGETFTGLEFMTSENVTTRNACAELIDFMKQCANNSTWVINTVLRVKESSDAQINAQGDNDSNQDRERDRPTGEAVVDEGTSSSNKSD